MTRLSDNGAGGKFMRIASLFSSDVVYLKNLVRAGLDGVTSARNDVHGGVFTPPLKDAPWTPVVLGAGIGILSACFDKNRRSVSRAALAGLVGSALGFGGGAAWASRRFTGMAARRAIRGVNNVRDARWLERNPIDYA
jgi:hypothetical protein